MEKVERCQEIPTIEIKCNSSSFLETMSVQISNKNDKLWIKHKDYWLESYESFDNLKNLLGKNKDDELIHVFMEISDNKSEKTYTYLIHSKDCIKIS